MAIETNLKVSVFKNYLNGERIAVSSVESVAQAIRRGDYADAVADYRCASPAMLATDRNGETVNRAVRMADNGIPRLCFATEFRRRNGTRCAVSRNALVLVEIDGLADFDMAVSLRRSASRQPYTLMAFVGANGRSVEIVCRVALADGSVPDGDAYRRLMAEGYRRLHYVYSAQLGVSIPVQAPVDDAMCLMSVDAGVYVEPCAFVMTVDGERRVPVFGGTVLKDKAGESPLPGKTADEAYRYIFYSCWNSVLDSGLNASDPFFAEQAITMLARRCRRSGLPMQLCVDRALMIDMINRDRDLVTLLFNQAYANNAAYATDPTAYVPAPALVAMKTDFFFRTHFHLRRNVLTGVTLYKPIGAYDTDYRPVTQEVVNAIAVMAQREGIRVWARDIKERVNSTLVDEYNPIDDYLASLPCWDGLDRLAAFAARVPTACPCWAEMFLLWMRSMVAHWMGLDLLHGNSLVPLLVGEQGCGKSSFAKIILPLELRTYYNDRIDFRNDNTLMLGLSSFALVNIDEFDRYSDHRQPLMKYIISKGEVTAVKAYRSTFSTERRYASFIATTNNPHPLTDPTGSRRFVCAAVTGRIDFASPVDYPQLYAQLVGEVRGGAAWYPDDEAVKRLVDNNRQFLRLSDLDDILSALFRKPSSAETAVELTATQLAAVVRREYPKFPPSKASAKAVGRALASLGFNSRHSRKGTCYMVETTAE